MTIALEHVCDLVVELSPPHEMGAALSGTRIDAAESWRIMLDQPGGRKALVLWNPKGAARYTLPSAYRGGTVTDLDGQTSPLPGAAIDLSEAPVLVTAP